MRSISFLDYFLDEPGHALLTLLHEKSSGLLLILAAGMLGAFVQESPLTRFCEAKHAFFVVQPGHPRRRFGVAAARGGGLCPLWILDAAEPLQPGRSDSHATNTGHVRADEAQRPRSTNGRPDILAKPNPDRISETSAVATGTSLPKWVQDKEFITGNVRLAVVTGEIGATVEEAVANARKAAIDLVRVDFAATFRKWPAGGLPPRSWPTPPFGRPSSRKSTAKRSPRERPSASTAATTRSNSRRASETRSIPCGEPKSSTGESGPWAAWPAC